MLLCDHIENWLDEQVKDGRTRNEIHNTYFAYKDSIAVIKKTGRSGYTISHYCEPKAVIFKD